MKSLSTIKYVLSAVIIVILIALAWWYFFLRSREAVIAREDAGRGAGLPAQSFGSNVGSTYENIVSAFSTFVGGGGNENTDGLPRLLQVGKTPTAGMGFVRSGTSTRLRFVERSTGYVLEVDPMTGALARLTNTLIPHIYSALVTSSGKLVMTSVNEEGSVTAFSGSIMASSSTSGATYVLSQKQLPLDIRSIAASPSGEEIFYIADGPGGAVGIRAAWDGTKQKRVFSSAIFGWHARWIGNDRIVLVQKPSDNVAGFAYVIEKDGTLFPLLRNIPGLTALPRDASTALIYGASSGGLSLFARVNERSATASLPLRTVADKCVWSPGTQLIAYCAVPQISPGYNFLDRWYLGEVHTSDQWWRINVSAASAELLYSPGNVALDVEDPVVDADGNYIAFVNSRDKSLWLLRIIE